MLPLLLEILPMPPCKGHKKSRNGCIVCKRRRIKVWNCYRWNSRNKAHTQHCSRLVRRDASDVQEMRYTQWFTFLQVQQRCFFNRKPIYLGTIFRRGRIEHIGSPCFSAYSDAGHRGKWPLCTRNWPRSLCVNLFCAPSNRFIDLFPRFLFFTTLDGRSTTVYQLYRAHSYARRTFLPDCCTISIFYIRYLHNFVIIRPRRFETPMVASNTYSKSSPSISASFNPRNNLCAHRQAVYGRR